MAATCVHLGRMEPTEPRPPPVDHQTRVEPVAVRRYMWGRGGGASAGSDAQRASLEGAARADDRCPEGM